MYVTLHALPIGKLSYLNVNVIVCIRDYVCVPGQTSTSQKIYIMRQKLFAPKNKLDDAEALALLAISLAYVHKIRR